MTIRLRRYPTHFRPGPLGPDQSRLRGLAGLAGLALVLMLIALKPGLATLAEPNVSAQTKPIHWAQFKLLPLAA